MENVASPGGHRKTNDTGGAGQPPAVDHGPLNRGAGRDRPHTRAWIAGIPTIPVVPPLAPLAPGVECWGDRGKVPGLATARGWMPVGVAALAGRRSRAAVEAWDIVGAGAGVPAARFPWFDCDVSDWRLSDAIMDWLANWFAARGKAGQGGSFPHRVGAPPKWAMLMELEEPEGVEAPNVDIRFRDPATGHAHIVQLLGRGKHAVAWGEHPRTGGAYTWHGLDEVQGAADIFDAGKAYLVGVTVADLLSLADDLRDWLLGRGLEVHVGRSVPGVVAPPELQAPGGEAQVSALMDALPNDPAVFPGRWDWLCVGQALLGALPEAAAPGAAQELFVAWSEKYPAGQDQDPAHEFSKLNPSMSLGWNFLLDKAKACGLAGFAAGLDFDEVDLELDRRMSGLVEALSVSATRAAQLAATRGSAEAMMDGIMGADPLPPPGLDADPVAQLDAMVDTGLGTAGAHGLDPGTGAAVGGGLPPVVPPMVGLLEVASREAHAMGLGPRPWLYGHYYQRATVVVLAGPGAVAKSNLALVELAAMVTDTALLGVPVWEPGLKVAHMNWDETTDEIERRMRAVFSRHGVPWQALAGRAWFAGVERLKFRLTESDGRGGQKLSEAGLRGLWDTIRALELDVVQIDPLGAVVGAINDNDLVYGLMVALSRIAARTGCCIQLTHHFRKLSGGGGDGDGDGLSAVDAIKGASALVQAARFARVMMVMSEKEATALGVDPKSRKLHVRIENAKANHVSPLDEAVWVKLEAVGLNNAAGRRGEDKTGVPIAWAPPAPVVTPAQRADILTDINAAFRAGRGYSMDPRAAADRSAPGLVADRARVTAGQARRILEDWVSAGWLEVQTYQDVVSRKEKRGLAVVLDPTRWDHDAP